MYLFCRGCNTISNICQDILKSANLLHKRAHDDSQLHITVHTSCLQFLVFAKCDLKHPTSVGISLDELRACKGLACVAAVENSFKNFLFSLSGG